MGYRSDVLTAIMFNTREDIVAFSAKYRVANKEPHVSELAKFNVLKANNRLVLFAYHENVKWYESYEDVSAILEILEDANDAGFSTLSIRVGEEVQDIAIDPYFADGQLPDAYDMHDLFGVNRSIYMPEEAGVEITKYLATKETIKE